MSTLAKFMIVAVATVSTQVMAAKDPFAAMEPIGHSQHGNMSNDTLKPFKAFNKDEGVEDVDSAKPSVKPEEVAKPATAASESVTKQETEIAKADKTAEKESNSGSGLEEFTVKTEKFLDEVTFSRGVNNALFQDGETD